MQKTYACVHLCKSVVMLVCVRITVHAASNACVCGCVYVCVCDINLHARNIHPSVTLWVFATSAGGCEEVHTNSNKRSPSITTAPVCSYDGSGHSSLQGAPAVAMLIWPMCLCFSISTRTELSIATSSRRTCCTLTCRWTPC